MRNVYSIYSLMLDMEPTWETEIYWRGEEQQLTLTTPRSRCGAKPPEERKAGGGGGGKYILSIEEL